MNICKKSNVYFIKRISVYWGDYSQVQCELNLLKAAIKGNYQYYHLISGVDLPIKSQDYIHNFFDLNENIQYVRFAGKWDNSRVNKINILNKLNRFNNLLLIKIKNLFNLPFNYLYGKGYDYTQKFNYTIEKGDNCFSITDSAAKYIVSQERIIKKYLSILYVQMNTSFIRYFLIQNSKNICRIIHVYEKLIGKEGNHILIEKMIIIC